MKIVLLFATCCVTLSTVVSCRSAKKLQSAVSSNKKDTVLIATEKLAPVDSVNVAAGIMAGIKKNYIDFKTFSAKIKVDYSDGRGRQPDVNAFVRIRKDSAIWISINATFLNVEAFRILINKDSMWVMNKLQKKIEYHSLDYLEKVAKIPLDFNTLQELIIGNPVFFGKTIVNYTKAENRITLSTTDEYFKNLLTLTANNYLVERSKLDDLNVALNRTADLTYTDYENKPGFYFSTFRQITITEKTRVNVTFDYKQYDFNKELSFPFNIPKNYK